MTIKKFDYSKSTVDIFYKIIYPVYAKEFLYGDKYEDFALTVSANFILNSQQWEYILEHWEAKEKIKTIENTDDRYEIEYCYGGPRRGDMIHKVTIIGRSTDDALNNFKKVYRYEEIYKITKQTTL